MRWGLIVFQPYYSFHMFNLSFHVFDCHSIQWRVASNIQYSHWNPSYTIFMHLVAWNRISEHVETAVCVVMGIWHQPINQLLAFSAPNSHLYYVDVALRWFYGLCWRFAFIRFNKQHFVSSGLLRVPNICRLCYCCSAFPDIIKFFFIYMFRFRDILSVCVFTRFCIWEQHRVLAKRRSTVGVTEKTITLVTVTS